jgi:hypothetical protein
MTKLTPAQAYAAQAKAHRKAAAAERRDVAIREDNNRINEMFTVKETKMKNDKVLQWDELPDSVQAQVSEIAPLFKEQTGVEFPRTVYFGESDWGGDYTYWVDGDALPRSFPAFYGKTGRACAKFKRKTGHGYGFRTPAISTVLNRLRAGKPVIVSKN